MNACNTNSAVHLLENGLVVMLHGRNWVIRRDDPDETFDSKWDVWSGRSWGSASYLCFDGEYECFKTMEEAVGVANSIKV